MVILINRMEFDHIDCSTKAEVCYDRIPTIKVNYTIIFNNRDELTGDTTTLTFRLDWIKEEIRAKFKDQ